MFRSYIMPSDTPSPAAQRSAAKKPTPKPLPPEEMGFFASKCGRSFEIQRFQVWNTIHGQGAQGGWKRRDYKTQPKPWECTTTKRSKKEGLKQGLKCKANV